MQRGHTLYWLALQTIHCDKAITPAINFLLYVKGQMQKNCQQMLSVYMST